MQISTHHIACTFSVQLWYML